MKIQLFLETILGGLPSIIMIFEKINRKSKDFFGLWSVM